jgi:hypothetical protein
MRQPYHLPAGVGHTGYARFGHKDSGRERPEKGFYFGRAFVRIVFVEFSESALVNVFVLHNTADKTAGSTYFFGNEQIGSGYDAGDFISCFAVAANGNGYQV